MAPPVPDWDGALVRRWLESRIAAARADQVAAERAGYGAHDDCDKAAAEEMVCSTVQGEAATVTRADLLAALKQLADRDQYLWRGVYDDDRFDRHVRAYVRKVVKMAKTGTGFDNLKRYQ